MAEKELTVEQRKLDVDLWVIALISVAVLAVYIILQNQFVAVVTDSDINILLRVLLGAAVQFGLSVLLCSLYFVPYIIFMMSTGPDNKLFTFSVCLDNARGIIKRFSLKHYWRYYNRPCLGLL